MAWNYNNYNNSDDNNIRKKFDLDLQYGKMREKKIHDMFFKKKLK